MRNTKTVGQIGDNVPKCPIKIFILIQVSDNVLITLIVLFQGFKQVGRHFHVAVAYISTLS